MATPATPQDRDKFRELILYVATKSEGDPNFGRTKLNKILFYCDFLAYRMLGRPISGQAYQKLEHGPAPRALMPVVTDMAEAGHCFWREKRHFGHRQKRLMANRDADLGLFSPQEVDLVNEVLSELWHDNAASVSELSHTFLGWQAAELGEDIPYETVFVGGPSPMSQDDLEYAQGVIDEYLAAVPDDHPPA